MLFIQSLSLSTVVCREPHCRWGGFGDGEKWGRLASALSDQPIKCRLILLLLSDFVPHFIEATGQDYLLVLVFDEQIILYTL